MSRPTCGSVTGFVATVRPPEGRSKKSVSPGTKMWNTEKRFLAGLWEVRRRILRPFRWSEPRGPDLRYVFSRPRCTQHREKADWPLQTTPWRGPCWRWVSGGQPVLLAGRADQCNLRLPRGDALRRRGPSRVGRAGVIQLFCEGLLRRCQTWQPRRSPELRLHHGDGLQSSVFHGHVEKCVFCVERPNSRLEAEAGWLHQPYSNAVPGLLRDSAQIFGFPGHLRPTRTETAVQKGRGASRWNRGHSSTAGGVCLLRTLLGVLSKRPSRNSQRESFSWSPSSIAVVSFHSCNGSCSCYISVVVIRHIHTAHLCQNKVEKNCTCAAAFIHDLTFF